MQINYCPACGHNEFSNSNPKHWQCKNCGFEYFHNMAAAVAGIICCGDKILLTRRKFNPGQGLLDLPGGFVDYGESLEQAIARECQEELALDNVDWHYQFSFPNEYRYANVLYHTQDAFFQTQLTHKPHIIPQDDVAEALWVPIKEINPSDFAFNSVRHAMRRWLTK